MMKAIRYLLILVVPIFIIVYHGLTVKAQKVRAVRFSMDYQEGKISQQEYERLNRENSYFKAFLNPKEVLGVK